jgi:hypothetical protein
LSRAILGSVALIVIVYLSARDWRRTLYAVFILVIFEGALRKWFLPQFSDLLYFLKDLMLLGAYLRFFLFSDSSPKRPIRSYPIKYFLILIAGWCLFQVFNPSLGSPIVGLFGLRGYLFYMPLMWLIPNLFETENDLYRALRSYLLLVIPVGILGILQFYSPASSPLNVYSGGADPTAGFSGIERIRITGTFPYISGYAVYLRVCFAVLVPVLLRPQPRLWRLASLTAMVLVVANSLMTGSRSVILFEALYILGFISLIGLRQPSQMQKYVRRFSLPILLTGVVLTRWLHPALDAFTSRATSSDNIVNRVTNTFSFLPYFQFKGLDGYGVGATHQAISTLRSVLQLPGGENIPIGFESEMGRIALELGPLGFFLWYGLRIVLIWAFFRLFWKLHHPFLQHLALAAFLTHLILLTGQLVVHNVFSIYYWSMAGFIVLLPYLDQVETWRANQSDHYVPNLHAPIRRFLSSRPRLTLMRSMPRLPSPKRVHSMKSSQLWLITPMGN